MYTATIKKEFAIDLHNILKKIDNKNDFEEVTFRVTPTNTIMHGMNKAKCMSILCELHNDDIYSKYNTTKIKKELTYNLKVNLLKTIIGRLKSDDIESVYFQNQLVLENTKGRFTIPVYDVMEEDKSYPMAPLVFNTELSLNTDNLYEILESGASILGGTSGTFEFELKDGKFSIRTTEDSSSPNFSYTFDSADVILQEGKDADSISKYTWKFLSYADLPFEDIEIAFNKEYPILLLYRYSGASSIKFFIAPRVDNT